MQEIMNSKESLKELLNDYTVELKEVVENAREKEEFDPDDVFNEIDEIILKTKEIENCIEQTFLLGRVQLLDDESDEIQFVPVFTIQNRNMSDYSLIEEYDFDPEEEFDLFYEKLIKE